MSLALLRGLRIANVAPGCGFLVAIAASIVFAGLLEARLTAKYAHQIDPVAVRHFIEALFLLSVVAALLVDRLFAALLAILRSIGADEPFSAANAARVRTIGWMLLGLQLLDLALGGAVMIAPHLRIDFITWSPGLTGWIGVLVAFVLARVFTVGADMRDDLAGTV